MPTVLERIMDDALRLPEPERVFLADRLISSISDEPTSDLDVAWLAEVERRYAGYKTGDRQSVPCQDVIRIPEQGTIRGSHFVWLHLTTPR